MRILLLFLTLTFAGELEVEGDLKVSGNIDAQNQAIKNVGIPTDLTDAINAQILQDALRDDGPFEYKMYITRLYHLGWENQIRYYEFQEGVSVTNNDSEWSDDFHNEAFSLLINGWKIDQTIDYSYSGGDATNYTWYAKQLIIFKRPLEE